MDGNRSYYGGGGGGGARGRGGGGRRNNYRGGGGGRGRGYRHSPYNSNSNSNSNSSNHNHRPGGGGGGGGRGRSSNRFGHNQQQQDPQATLKKQIASFVSRVGELQNLRTPAPEETVTSTSMSTSTSTSTLRTVEYTTASNINDLVPILLAPDKIELLLKYSPDALQVADKVGHLVHLVVSCAADLPLQTPCYAALTLALDVSLNNNNNNIDDSSSPSPSPSPYQGFGTRCLQYTMLQIAKELDTTLLTHCTQSAAGATCRLKLLLRYLCLLAQLGMVQAYDVDSVAAATATAGAGTTTPTTTSVDPNRMTVFGLLSVLVDAATAATDQFQAPAASQWLALLVLSTLPYVLEWTDVPRDIVDDKLRRPLEALLANYQSTFVPGTGKTALLLKEPQVEEGDEDDDDDDDEEEEEEEDDSAGQVCDSLQDLLRATKYWRVEGQASRFALPVDAPWKGLLMAPSPPPSEGGANPTTTTTTPVVQQPMEYTGAPLYLAFPQECQLLNLLLGGAGSGSPLKIQYFSLEGAVFGRLPIFGSPPNPEDDDDEEEDMDDVAAAAKNEQLQAFQAMSLLDRYFVAETLRDVLLSHESHVTATGLQMGSAKAAAEELLRVGHVFSNDESSTTVDPSKGMEYAILETILALLAQSTEYSTVRHSYLSRVLLELTRLEPSRLSQALAVAVTNLFQDYLPALVPAARENYSRWFAFHLVNTDYQWPSAFWQLWQPYATSEQASSRGAFVRRAIQYMAENVCDPTPIAQQCFGAGDFSQALVREILGRNAVTLEEPGAEAVLSELRRRLWDIWDSPEDSALVLEYVTGEEMATALGGAVPWARTDILLRVLMDPARELEQDVKAALEKATTVAIEGDAGEDGMEAEETAFSKDVHVAITDCMTRYKSTIAGALEKDAEGADDKDAALVQGAAFLLRRVESMTSFNQGLMESIVAYLVQERIVPELAVLRWVLRQVGDSVLAPVSSSWSRFATVAVREGLILLTSEATAGGIMVMDGAATDSEAELATKLTAKVAEILQYVIQRVCGLLTTTQADDKKLKPLHVELLEGTKGLVVHSKHLLISTLTRPTGLRKGMSASDVEDGLSKSEIAGSSLAALCTGEESSMAVKLLKTSLENI